MGEAYPGSTGGEIFNCYEGTNRNVASGDYSTAIGEQCQATGKWSFAGGNNTTASGNDSFAFGSTNAAGLSSIAMGYKNDVKLRSVSIGYDNYKNWGPSNDDIILVGRGLRSKAQDVTLATGRWIFGSYNELRPYLPYSYLVLGCGWAEGERKTALEANSQGLVCLPHGLCLDSNTSIANAITPPADPSNPTADEQTLATKAYVASQVPSLAALQGITFKRSETAVTGQTTNLTPETAYNLESTFSITIPSWATHMFIGYDINGTQGYTRLNIGNTGNYSVVVEHGQELDSCELEWNSSTKEFIPHTIYAWTGTTPSASIYTFNVLSIRFEGDYTPFPISP